MGRPLEHALVGGKGVADFLDFAGETGSYFDIRQTRVVKILECGDKNRAVRGSRHRFPSEPRAETLLVLTLSRIHLVVHT
jgi:hypothetical protein